MDLKKLNPMQRKAAETLEGPLLIIAGAGSGKTRTMTFRIANLMAHGVPPRSIMALTFTNKAAREMLERVAELVGEDAQQAWIGTFHSICVRILRRDIEKLGYQRSFVIYDEDDQQRILRDIYKQLDQDEKQLPVREMRAIISDAKNRLLTADEWFKESHKDFRSQRIHDIFTMYDQRLRKANALDFDDIISHTLQLLVDHPPVMQYYRDRFKYVHVDEYQDTNFAQYSLVRLFTEESRNLCVVGDDDQSIYGWRGADVRNILEFKKDFPDAVVIKLEQNYRSTSTILDASNQLIANNTGRMDKKLWTEDEEGEPIRFYDAVDERGEGAWVCERIRRLRKLEKVQYSEMAVLYRMHAQSRVLEEMLMRAGIPYRVYGGTRFYDRKEVRDALAYLRLLINSQDEVALKRIINVPKRSIGDATVAILEKEALDKDVPMFVVLSDMPEALSSRPRKCVTAFTDLINKLLATKDTMELVEFVEYMLKETGLLAQYENTNDEELITKRENLLEFVGAVQDFQNNSDDKSLEAFLENVSLVTDLDMQMEASQFVTLMTMHSAKGLEFDAVFITGMEEGLFPSHRSMQDEDKMEEERRLCYVGMTRARKYLHLSLARRRSLYNQISFGDRSRFIGEMPKNLMTDVWGKAMREHFGDEEEPREDYPRHEPKPLKMGFGNPGIGQKLKDIPGVTKGFVPSKAREMAEPPAIFRTGDRVLHKKFGEGTVRDIDDAAGRITIFFTAYGEKQFSLSIAPIAKIE
ncbi:MAG: 3'-5' exonuclease [Eubacteriales bacterium]|nr:3'-5' exonuclease [Eubacteriales bacterium]MDD4105933.1 3'-5' exonuclease [Eubacteriales bacterium]MDD4711639.1 3'-5' exonuclease [Eubacteriales bacterium]